MNLKNKKVLVTGACGFIGSHLVEALHAEGANIVALAEYNRAGDPGWLGTIDTERGEGSNILRRMGDVRSLAFCQDILSDVDICFHLAAQVSVPYSFEAPEVFIQNNVMGGYNICQAAHDRGVKKLVFVSSSEVYGTARYTPIDEEHPLQPQSPYAASKVGAEAIAKSFFHSYGLPVVIARPFNTYGPRQSRRAEIADLIMQMINGDLIEHGRLDSKRSFNYVTDTCRGLIACLDVPDGEVVNIGMRDNPTIERVIDHIIILSGRGHMYSKKYKEERARPDSAEVMSLSCNPFKLNMLTGWEPQVSLDQGLTKTIEWFREHGHQYHRNYHT